MPTSVQLLIFINTLVEMLCVLGTKCWRARVTAEKWYLKTFTVNVTLFKYALSKPIYVVAKTFLKILTCKDLFKILCLCMSVNKIWLVKCSIIFFNIVLLDVLGKRHYSLISLLSKLCKTGFHQKQYFY